MKKIQPVLCVLIMICLCSCEKDADVKLPKVEEKLVVVCAISPQDTLIKVDVSLSQPIYNVSPTNSQHVSVKNATVIISSDAGSWTLPYDAAYERYVIDSKQLNVKAGLIYNLSVSTPDGKFVKAFTSIPYQNTTLSCTTEPDPKSVNNVIVHARWQDPVASTDYYKFELQNNNFTNYWTHKSDLLTDEDNPGGILKRDLSFQYNASSTDSIIAVVYTLSSELYNYYDHLNKVNGANGPFSEPSPMYTNLEGGFGVFGGFNRYKIRVLP
jgi:hypothetical protein